MPLPVTPLFINGEQVPSNTGDTFEVRNPSSNTVVGLSASASSEDCKAAITAAGNALKHWEQWKVIDRCQVFLRAADIVKTDKYKKMIVQANQEETAASPSMSLFNWFASETLLRETAAYAGALHGESLPSERVKGAMVVTHRRAMGVILCMAPWNAPTVLTFRAIATPILSGNTVVFRSSELSPRSQAIIAEVFKEAGLPAGVLNFISTSRETTPALVAEMIAHPLIRKINFTGSDRVGRVIAMEAAKHLKPCTLELGGKAPAIVLEDADLDEAAKAVVMGAMLHSGQICMSTERIIVQRSVFDVFSKKVCELASSLKAGDVETDKTVKLTGLFSEASAENVVSMVREAQAEGARILVGDLARAGNVVQPHVVTDVKPGMRLWERETFGPVVILSAADNVDEAVELANASDYSLTSSLWTNNLYLAQDVAFRLHAGYTNINGSTIHSEGSYGLLGLGGSSGYGRFSVEDFTDRRVIVTHPRKGNYPLFD